MWLTPLVLISALLLFAFAQWVLRNRYPKNNQALIDVIDQVLPQTQCAQCGYPGCRPYATAIVGGEALNLCPPGGEDVHATLNHLMGVPASEIQGSMPPAKPVPAVVIIDENQCIGCALCLPPCPVDAIVGAANKMHTVLKSQCTGCELCIPACPVDCITVHPLPPPAIVSPAKRKRTNHAQRQPARACIACGLCNPVCPVGLPAQALLHALQHQQLPLAATQGLTDCIECGFCDRACPSHINMAALFAIGKNQLQQQQASERERLDFKQRYQTHVNRQALAQAAASDKRVKRLQRADRWS